MSRSQKIILRVGLFLSNLPVLGKLLKRFLDFLGWSTAPEDFMGLFSNLDQMPWYLAAFMAFAAWVIYFLAPPLLRKYVSGQVPLPPYDPAHEAKAIINEIVYGGHMKVLEPTHINAVAAAEIIERCLRESMLHSEKQ